MQNIINKGIFVFFLILGLSSCAEDSNFSGNTERKVRKAKVDSGEATGEAPEVGSSDNLPDAPSSSAPDEAQAPDPEAPEEIADAGDDEPTNTILRTFETGAIQSAQVKIDANGGVTHKNEVPLVRNYPDVMETLYQNNRTPGTERFDQGQPASTKSQTFNADVAYGPIDIVVVIDNSGSMSQEQAKLAPNLASLLTYISHTSWQVGVISTDTQDTCLRRLIKKGDANAQTAFQEVIDGAGTNGSGDEKGLYQAKTGLSCSNWLQSGSAVAALIVSDEDNCSNGSCSNSAYGTGVLQTYLDSIRPSERTAVYGIINPPSDTCADAYNVANEYQKVITATGGTAGRICEASYDAILQQISQNISTIISKDFTLDETPIASSVEVLINGVATNNYTLSGKMLTLTQNPPANATITVNYTVTPSTLTKTFTLSRSDIASEDFVVRVNGSVSDPNTYQRSGATLTFASEPPAGAAIEVTYYLDSPKLLKTFAIKEAIKPGTTPVVTVDGTNTAVSFNEAKGEFSFANAPEDGAMINVNYKKVGNPILSYNVLTNPSDHELVSITFKSSGANANATLDNGVLKVDAGAFVEGEIIVVTTKTFPDMDFGVMLDHTPIAGSVKVVSSTCLNGTNYKVDGNKLSLECEMREGGTEFSYQYYEPAPLEFVLEGVDLSIEGTTIEVKVNGNIVSDFSIKDNKLSFGTPLPDVAAIEVTITQPLSKDSI